MADIELLMPKMGESVMEGTILSWLKKPGDTIEADEAVLEIATDKVDTEVPAPQGGRLKEILADKGAVIPVGTVIARIETEPAAAVQEPAGDAVAGADEQATTAVQQAPIMDASSAANVSETPSKRFFSPLVRTMAKKEGISLATLAQLPGSGRFGRFTKADFLAYLAQGKPQTTTAPTADSSARPLSVSASVSANDDIIEMDRMRQMIAGRMLESKKTSAHVTSFVEADLTRLVAFRERHKQAFYEKEAQALTLTPFFLQAVVRAIKDFPMVNISVSGTRIICHKDIHMGLAVALPNGNLIVPVIHHADRLSLRGLALATNDLARRARQEELKPDDLSGGTYTLSNVGTFGNVMGTPIIMQPQCAIMAFGLVKKRPVVITDPNTGEDTIGIRQMAYLSHSYDHRVIDGALGGMFATAVAKYLQEEQPDSF